MESYRLGTFRPHRFGQLSLCEGFGRPSRKEEILVPEVGIAVEVEVPKIRFRGSNGIPKGFNDWRKKGKTLQWEFAGVLLTSSPSSSILSFPVQVPAPGQANKPICGYVKKAICSY